MTLFMISIPFMPVAVGIASEFERYREQTQHPAEFVVTDDECFRIISRKRSLETLLS